MKIHEKRENEREERGERREREREGGRKGEYQSSANMWMKFGRTSAETYNTHTAAHSTAHKPISREQAASNLMRVS